MKTETYISVIESRLSRKREQLKAIEEVTRKSKTHSIKVIELKAVIEELTDILDILDTVRIAKE